ncbi:MAG TPA: hypothetical protein VFA00_07810 [Actinomycetota bacterium]|nr:hypothetical protein [Actinomycetota bacterium]
MYEAKSGDGIVVTVQARAQSGVPGGTGPTDTEVVTDQPITIT